MPKVEELCDAISIDTADNSMATLTLTAVNLIHHEHSYIPFPFIGIGNYVAGAGRAIT